MILLRTYEFELNSVVRRRKKENDKSELRSGEWHTKTEERSEEGRNTQR